MKNKKRKFSLKEQYVKSWKFIQNSRNFIWLIFALFFAAALIGFVIPIPEDIKKIILEYIKEILEKTSGMSGAELIAFIFLNNFEASFFGMCFGIFTIGIIPLFLILMNGYVLGYVASVSAETSGAVSLLGLLPHGIFELPAVFISLAMGLKMGIYVFKKDRRKFFKNLVLDSLRVFVFVVVPLLIIAAIIEGLLIVLGA